jgi:hypothetical protein
MPVSLLALSDPNQRFRAPACSTPSCGRTLVFLFVVQMLRLGFSKLDVNEQTDIDEARKIREIAPFRLPAFVGSE